MKRLLLIVIPLLLIGGLVLLNRWLDDQHYVLTGENGAVLYAASFDGAADASDASFNDEWEQYPGILESKIENSVLQLSIGSGNRGAYSLADHRFSDFDFRVDARAIDSPLDNAYGIIFRAQDRQNYYLFQVSSDGYYRVVRVLDGDERELSTWVDMPIVRQGLNATNQLRVVARGSEFQFYINGEQVQLCIPNDPSAISTYYLDTCLEGEMLDTLVDDTISEGKLGVSAQAFRLPEGAFGVITEFDNVVVFGA